MDYRTIDIEVGKSFALDVSKAQFCVLTQSSGSLFSGILISMHDCKGFDFALRIE